MLKTKPFFVHLINESNVKTKYTISNVYKLLSVFLKISTTYFILKGLNTKRRDGNKVKTDTIANSIAIPVKIPK